MKTTYLTLTTLVLTLTLFSCSEDEGIKDHIDNLKKKGKASFLVKEVPREPIRLTNARTQATKADAYILEIWQDDELIIGDLIMQETDELELPVGDYTAVLQVIDDSDKYKGNIKAEGSDDFTITADATTTVELVAYYNTTTVTVSLPDHMADATVWAGEEGFTPDDSYLLTDIGGHDYFGYFYADDNFDVVVTWEGQTKRFTAANNNPEYIITIAHDPDQQTPENGTAGFSWQLEDVLADQITFNW